MQSTIRDDRSLLELLSANYTFLNERLARHYGIPGVYGDRFRRVTLDENHPRGGLLGHGATGRCCGICYQTQIHSAHLSRLF